MKDVNTRIRCRQITAFLAALKTKLRSAVLFAGVFLFPVASSTQSALPIDAFYRIQNEIANDWHTCFEFLREQENKNISPYGPAYWDDFLVCWEGTGVSDDFRKLEVHIRQIAQQAAKIREQE